MVDFALLILRLTLGGLLHRQTCVTGRQQVAERRQR